MKKQHFYELYGLTTKGVKAISSNTPPLGQESKRYNMFAWMKTMFGGEYNPDKLKHHDYMEMLRDPQVDTAYSLITDMLLSKKLLITPASKDPLDEEISDFCNDMVDNLSISMRQTRSNLYSAILFGFAVAENVYKVDPTSKIVLDRIKGIDIRTIWNGLVYDDNGDIEEVIQTIWGTATYDPIHIPADKCIIYSRNPLHGNLYGRSDFNSIYDIEFMKSQILRILMIFLQKHAAPSLAGFKGENGDVGEMQANLDEIMEGRANIVFPQGDDVKILESQKNGEAFFSAINYLDNMIFRRLKIGSLLLGQADNQGGSYAQSQTHDTILGIALDGIHEELAGLLESSFRKIIDYNFMTTTYPNFIFEAFKETDVIALLNALAPYGKYALVDFDEAWFKQVLSIIIERMTGVKMDISEMPMLPSPMPASKAIEPDVPEDNPVVNDTSTTTPSTITNLNDNLKTLLPASK